MKDIILFSASSFLLIMFGVLYFMGFISIGPVAEPVDTTAEILKVREQMALLEVQKQDLERRKNDVLSLENEFEIERKLIATEREQLGLTLERIAKGSLELDDERLERIAKLAKMFGSMKPDKAATIASALDMELLINIVSRMKEKDAAKLLSALPPKLAAEVSRRIGKLNRG